MNKCDCCGKYFHERGTDTLPSNFCSPCMDEGRVRFVEVERTTIDMTDHCNYVIKIHEDNIKKSEEKYNEEITRSKEAIKWARSEISRLTLE